MKKRILGIILCLCLLVQLLPAVGLASDTITGIVPLKAGQDVATDPLRAGRQELHLPGLYQGSRWLPLQL